MKPGRPRAWHCLPADAVLLKLHTAATGLSAVEAADRLASNGPNELPDRRRNGALTMLASQFSSLMTWILIAAGLIAGFVGETVDAIVILLIVGVIWLKKEKAAVCNSI